jgi:Tfp pilus assembly protein PilO
MIGNLAKRLAPWQTHAVGILLMLALSVLVYLFEINPLYDHYRDRHMRVGQLAEQVNHTRELNTTLNRTRNAAAELQIFLKDHGFTLESRSRLNDRLTAIIALATECGLVPDGIEPQRQSAEPLFTTIALRLSARGSYPNCVRFLEKLRRDMPHNTIAGIELSAAPSGKDAEVAFNLQLIWHAAPTP